MAGNARATGVSVTSRVLDVLGAFDRRHRRLTLSDISRRAALPLATTHRLVAELERRHALHRGDDGTYEIGRRLWDLGMLAAVQADLRELAQPYAQDVHRATGETVQLAVRDELSTLYVERIAGPTTAQVLSRTGMRLPLHATALGKVLLAYAPADVVRAALEAPARVTSHTITEAGRLHREITECRRRGFARTAEELTLGAWSVAVPIAAPAGEVVAAIGIVVANSRRDLERLVPVLQVAAHGIGRCLPQRWAAY